MLYQSELFVISNEPEGQTMKFPYNLSALLRIIGRRLQARAACTLTGVEPEWLAICEQRPAALPADAADDDAALRLARAL